MVLKNMALGTLPCHPGDAGSIPGQRTKISHAAEQLSPRATTRVSKCHSQRSCMMQRRSQMLQPRSMQPNKYLKNPIIFVFKWALVSERPEWGSLFSSH